MAIFYGQHVLFFMFLIKIMLAAPTDLNQTTESTDFLEECGISMAILSPDDDDGSESPVSAWPWMAALFLKSAQDGVVLCGGAVISHYHILTAGHCVNELKPDELVVRLGEHDIESDSDYVYPINFNVKGIFTYDKYQKDPLHYDIGVLEVDDRIEYSHDIQPVCLPTIEMSEMSFDDEKPYIAGWGRISYDEEQSPKLRHVQLRVEPNEICAIAYASIINIKPNQLCAGFGGRDACQGDSGGPLVVSINNTWFAIGVISLGIKCGVPGFPGIYARTTSYINWLRNIIKV